MNLLKWLQKKTRYTISSQDIFSPVEQEDPRTQESIKRTRKNFEEQQEQMQARAMKPHAFDCPDPWTCKKSPCFIWEPDKIVGEYIVPLKTKKKRAFDQRAYEINGRRDEDDRKLFEDLNNKLDI